MKVQAIKRPETKKTTLGSLPPRSIGLDSQGNLWMYDGVYLINILCGTKYKVISGTYVLHSICDTPIEILLDGTEITLTV